MSRGWWMVSRGSEAAGRVEVWITSLSTKVFHNNVLLKEFDSCKFKSNNSHGGIKFERLYLMEFSNHFCVNNFKTCLL